MKKARMNISHFRFIFFNLKTFGEVVTAIAYLRKKLTGLLTFKPKPIAQ